MSEQTNNDQRATDEAQKLEFARLLFEAGPAADSYQIAFDMFPANPNRAVLAGGHWRADPLVIGELNRLREKQTLVAETLPTQVELARTIWMKMQACEDPEAFVKLAKLYAEINGMMKKPGDAGQSGQVVRHVMQVTDHGDEISWEQKLLANQNQLQDDGLREIQGARVEN